MNAEPEKPRAAESTKRPVRQRQPTHPGEILREDVFPALRLSVAEAARQLRVSRRTLHRILAGRSIVTPEMTVFGRVREAGSGPAPPTLQARSPWR
ncbi:MAG: HigA family addiction module antitoxin [bacterium]